MMTMPKRWLPLATFSLALLMGCASVSPSVTSSAVASAEAAVRQVLAPTGTLRVGVYPGSPSSLVIDAKTGEKVGVALQLGQAMGRQLDVPVQVVEFERLALVLDGLKSGSADVTFTNATEVRARDVNFTPPLVQLELGYLVPPASLLQQVGDVDRAGIRVGVSQGSSSQAALGKMYTQASLVPAASLKQAQQLLREGRVDAFATNKAILFEMADALPGYRVLEGRWGLENLAIAIPKGREPAMSWVNRFAQDAKASGLLHGIVQRAGLRGVATGN